jgi:hypothetical protein
MTYLQFQIQPIASELIAILHFGKHTSTPNPKIFALIKYVVNVTCKFCICTFIVFSAYIPCFEKMEVDLRDHHAVCF